MKGRIEMGLKLGRLIKTVCALVSVLVLIITLQISSFAIYRDGPYKYNDSTNLEIVGLGTWWPSGEITIPSKATGIKAGVFKNNAIPSVNVTKITKVTIPSSVRYVESGAFSSDCTSLKEVVIQNARSNISVAGDAFPSGVSVTYTVEDTTVPPPTTTTTTAPPTTTAPQTQRPTQAPVSPVAPNRPTTTRSRKPVATKPRTTTTVPSTVTVTESDVPLAGTTGIDADTWNNMLKSTAPSEVKEAKAEKKEKAIFKSSLADYAINGSIVIVTFTAIALTYLKFKK